LWWWNQLLVFHFFGAFPSDRLPKEMKCVTVHFLTQVLEFLACSNSCHYSSKFRELFKETTCADNMTRKKA
jgi:hypothetical protein